MCRDVIGAEVILRQSCWQKGLTESHTPWASWPERHTALVIAGILAFPDNFLYPCFLPSVAFTECLGTKFLSSDARLNVYFTFPQLKLLAQANTCSGFVLFTQLELACSLDRLQNRTAYKIGKYIATLLFCTTSEHSFIYPFFLSQVTPSLFCKPWRFPRHICHKPSLLLQAWAVQPR